MSYEKSEREDREARIVERRLRDVAPGFPLLLGLVILVCIAQPGFAFHSGGVASCKGCHVMHDSNDGMIVGTASPGAPGLLLAETPSDVCLSCHADQYGSVLGADPLNPPQEKGAGNFIFLLEENLNDAPDGASNPIPGDAAGHNLDALGHGLAPDPRHSLSPGGSFPAGEMGCTSCHDPHGNSSFRMLRGVGSVRNGLSFFSFPAPSAEGIDFESSSESNNLHTAYLGGMSDWCGNCHGRYHVDTVTATVPGGGDPLVHPSDQPLNMPTRDRYNGYNGDADPTGGLPGTAYLAAVPFESAANTTTSSLGPGGGARVMCLTCHRAHATSSPAAGRWDFRVGLLAEDGLASGSYPIPDPFNSPSQGTLCGKCHEGGAPSPPGPPLGSSRAR